MPMLVRWFNILNLLYWNVEVHLEESIDIEVCIEVIYFLNLTPNIGKGVHNQIWAVSEA